MAFSSGKIFGFSTLGVAENFRKSCDLRSKFSIPSSQDWRKISQNPVAVFSCSGLLILLERAESKRKNSAWTWHTHADVPLEKGKNQSVKRALKKQTGRSNNDLVLLRGSLRGVCGGGGGGWVVLSENPKRGGLPGEGGRGICVK